MVFLFCRLGPLKGFQLKSGKFQYDFSLQLEEGEKVTLTPSASSLLFSPSTAIVVGGSDCTEGITFEAEIGKILKGKVLHAPSTPLAGAVVSLFDEEDELLDSQTTIADGFYRFGPLNATKKYR